MAILFVNWEKDIMEKMEGTMKKRLYQALLGLVLSASVAAGGFLLQYRRLLMRRMLRQIRSPDIILQIMCRMV